MVFEEKNDVLVISLNEDEIRELADYSLEEMCTDSAMHEFFEIELANSEWEWISPEEIGVLTDAPILGYKDKDDKVLEAYGFMDYQVKSLLEQLFDYNEATFIKG